MLWNCLPYIWHSLTILEGWLAAHYYQDFTVYVMLLGSSIFRQPKENAMVARKNRKANAVADHTGVHTANVEIEKQIVN